MSLFSNTLKTFTTYITGEPLELKINNAIWVLMKSKFKLGQLEWAQKSAEEESLYGAKFVVCVLEANGYETTEEEVVNHTDNKTIGEFIMAYQASMMERKEELNLNNDEMEVEDTEKK